MPGRINKIEQIAAQIAAAEIMNGTRTHWIHEMSEGKLDGIARASVLLAEKIVAYAAKHEPNETL